MVKVIGLTGSIAVGKSTVTHYLQSRGYTVLDADMISHQALEKGTPTYQKVVSLFGCMKEDGSIDRQQLGSIVFHDQDKKKQLEAIIHPYVIETIHKNIQQSLAPIIFLDIPLLFEAHLEYLCHKIMVVYVRESIQCQRLMQRNHISEAEAMHLIHQQISIEEKKNKADYIVNNENNIEDLYQNIERILKIINDEVIYE